MSSADTSGTVSAHRFGPSIALVAAVCRAAAIAACGGSGLGSGPSVVGGTTATGSSSPVALSRCMRAHGLTNFPDPKQGSGGLGFPGGLFMSSDGTLTVDGASFAGPVLKTAQQACKRFLPGGGGPPPPVSASQKKAALANAQCMRTHYEQLPRHQTRTRAAGLVEVRDHLKHLLQSDLVHPSPRASITPPWPPQTRQPVQPFVLRLYAVAA